MNSPVAAAQQQSHESIADRRKRLDREDLIAVLGTEPGQAVFWRILEHAHPYTANSGADEFKRGVHEGERRIALWLITLIEDADLAGMAKMMVGAGERAALRARDEQTLELARAQQQLESESRVDFWERSKRRIMGKLNQAT